MRAQIRQSIKFCVRISDIITFTFFLYGSFSGEIRRDVWIFTSDLPRRLSSSKLVAR